MAHLCWVWRLLQPSVTGFNWQEHQNDDGESRGSAGFQILQRLQHYEIVNSLAVIVREYWGQNYENQVLYKPMQIPQT